MLEWGGSYRLSSTMAWNKISSPVLFLNTHYSKKKIRFFYKNGFAIVVSKDTSKLNSSTERHKFRLDEVSTAN